MDDNKRKMINIETLKYETMQAIEQIIEGNSEDRKNGTKKKLNNAIINRFKGILEQKGIEFDEEYAYGQLDVLTSEIEKGNKVLDENLLTQINRLLNRHIEYAIEYPEEERDLNLQRNESRVDDGLEEDESQRRKKINNNQIPKVEEFLHDIFSHEMRRIDYREITLTEANREELKYEILSRLKHASSKEITSFFEGQNNNLTENIKIKLSEFFEAVNQELLQQEESEHDKKSWELTEEEMENVDPRKAVENIKENNGNEDRTRDELGPIIE
jgi:hypothetical protein